jgi:hypothetical protein
MPPMDQDEAVERLLRERGIPPVPRLQQLHVDPDRTWEDRGKADKAAVADTLRTMMGSTAADPYVKRLEQAIDALDRK